MTTKSGPAGADIPGARPTEKGGTLWTPREYRKPHRDDHDHQGQLVIDPETGEESGEYALYLCRRCASEVGR
jgi:hypothetical protein